MKIETLHCLGDTVNMKECYGPDDYVTKELGAKSCLTCVVPAYRKLSQECADLRVQAERDSLTHLFNRRMFDAKLEEKIAKGEVFGVLFIDLESFKKVNERNLHTGGDAMLKHTAKYLDKFFSDTLRKEDLVARIGGDEFGVIINSPREDGHLDDAAVEGIKTRLRENYAEVFFVAEYNERFGNDEPLSMHIGHTIWQPGMTVEDMMVAADPPKSDRTDS